MPHILHSSNTVYLMELRLEYFGTLWGITNNLHAWSHFWKAKAFFVHCEHQHQSERVFSHGGLFPRHHRAMMSEQLLCDLVLAKCKWNHKWYLRYLCRHCSITANAQLDAAIAVKFWFSLAFHCQTNDCTVCNVFSLFQHFLVLLWHSCNPSCSVALNGTKEKSGKWLLMRQTSIPFVIE